MKPLLAASLIFTACALAHADNDLSLLAYGASIHSQCSGKRCDFNGENPGLGLEWAPLGNDADGRWIGRVGSYRDSFRETAWFVAGGWRKEWQLGSSPLYAGTTLLAGYLDGSGVKQMVVFPMLSIGTRKLALEVGYVPKMDYTPHKTRVAVTTFSLRWTF
ncbi:hypothetical protein HNO92_002909 [Chromobacterium alkanivorans]|uniref:hypothetical protein n=1 Tax=Chromobacterium alkanivorans TaxID=1071719 RepID=UPI0019682691|nr:hypothetical protein [Chromobacterium alkanivorans]MBN3003149.1 hypothetical protein [Chromobacterium alkanivorans]MCS3803673.1 hypothetical protein [Chromobacterium alkanivorans]MCS3818222.1 hypothetical protein [Chromobacterium alkanivorans]MCS3874579.1 hypothetical protein [Chromobacterium alkanivorans]